MTRNSSVSAQKKYSVSAYLPVARNLQTRRDVLVAHAYNFLHHMVRCFAVERLYEIYGYFGAGTQHIRCIFHVSTGITGMKYGQSQDELSSSHITLAQQSEQFWRGSGSSVSPEGVLSVGAARF